MAIQFRPRDGKESLEFYSPSRDILGYYRPLHESVLSILAERYPDRETDIETLRGFNAMIINEATAGQQEMTIDDLLKAYEEACKVCAKDLLQEYTLLVAMSYTWRYVMAKREPFNNKLGNEELKKSFEGIYVLSILPPDLAAQVKQHFRSFRHLPEILFDNTPPCEAVEVPDDAIED